MFIIRLRRSLVPLVLVAFAAMWRPAPPGFSLSEPGGVRRIPGRRLPGVFHRRGGESPTTPSASRTPFPGLSGTMATRSQWLLSRTAGAPTQRISPPDLANAWGVGDPEEENGILVLVSFDERRTEVGDPGRHQCSRQRHRRFGQEFLLRG